jgi:sugar lactone lactonase YvrE
MSRLYIATLFVGIALVLACEKSPKQEMTTSSAQSNPAGTSTQATSTASMAPATMAQPQPGKPLITLKEGLNFSECFLYDPIEDLYLVSNVNPHGKPPFFEKNDGYITKVSPDGKVVAAKWIEGGKEKVTLRAPKGMALMDDKLYVADIDTVRIFDRRSGAPAGEVRIPGALFLNDAAATPDGRIVVSDTGFKASINGGLEKGGGDAVYAIDRTKKVTTIAKGTDLGQPNGLLAISDKIWVVTWGTGELYSLDANGVNGKKADAQTLPKGQLDGIVSIGGGDLLISSNEGREIFRGKPGGEFRSVITDVESPADIGYDDKRMRVLVPLIEKSEVRVYDIR